MYDPIPPEVRAALDALRAAAAPHGIRPSDMMHTDAVLAEGLDVVLGEPGALWVARYWPTVGGAQIVGASLRTVAEVEADGVTP